MNAYNCLLIFEVQDIQNESAFLDEHLLLIHALNHEAALQEAYAYADDNAGTVVTHHKHHLEWRFAGIRYIRPLSKDTKVQCVQTRELDYSAAYLKGLETQTSDFRVYSENH